MPYVFDALLLAVPLFLILRGFRRGFTRALMGLFRLAASLAVSVTLAPVVSVALSVASDRSLLLPVAAPLGRLLVGILLFAVTFVAMTLLSRFVVRLIRRSRFSGLDRLLGALVGAGTGGLALWAVSSALSDLLLALGAADWVSTSILLG